MNSFLSLVNLVEAVVLLFPIYFFFTCVNFLCLHDLPNQEDVATQSCWTLWKMPQSPLILLNSRGKS